MLPHIQLSPEIIFALILLVILFFYLNEKRMGKLTCLKTEKELLVSEAKYKELVDSLPEVIFELDIEGKLLYVNRNAYDYFNYTDEDMERGLNALNMVVPEDVGRVKENMARILKGEKLGWNEYTAVRKDGSTFPVLIHSKIILIDGKPAGFRGLIIDITGRKKYIDSILISEARFQSIFNSVNDTIIVHDAETGQVLDANIKITEIFGYYVQEITNIGMNAFTSEAPYSEIEALSKIQLAAGGEPQLFEWPIKHKNGHKIWTEVNLKRAVIADKDCVLAIVRDITERKMAQEQLMHLANYDSLTGIPNRYYFEENLKRCVARAKRSEKSALLFIDIDNFKIINDSKGHSAGDEALIGLVNILKRNLRQSDLLARLGGDEFAVLLEGISEDNAALVADKLRKAVESTDIYLTTYQFHVSISVSIGVVNINGTINSTKLLSLADNALHLAKENGRNRILVVNHDEGFIERLAEVNKIVDLVKKSLKEDRFKLLYQPVVLISTGETTHYEALLRMPGDDGSQILPGVFIPVAEKFGLMPQIDRWVVENAINTLRQRSDLKLFVNLSGVSLNEESLLELIEDKIKENKIEPSRLGFEITETAAVKDLMLAERWITRIKKMGCQFALDDFGIGLSSLSYLRMLPVDYLKIDGSFVRNLDKDTYNVAMVQAIRALAHSLGKKTIAEYVENDRVLKILHELEVDCGQGYFLGTPSNELIN